MRTFNVTLRCVVYETYNVEANNEDQAFESAKENFATKFGDYIDGKDYIEVEEYNEE